MCLRDGGSNYEHVDDNNSKGNNTRACYDIPVEMYQSK